MDREVLIIGAGTAGLTATYELLKRGIKPEVIDEAAEVASSWRRRHDQLRLNVARPYASLPGASIPRRYGAYLKRDDFVSYLEAYVADLGHPIRFGVHAQEISRNGNDGWLVGTDQGEIRARHVIVATGPERVPFTPELPGRDKFQGEFIHSAEFRHADDYVGKRVLIIGASNSGIDIANHLAKVAFDSGWMSVRTGQTVAPAYIFGLAAHPLVMWIRWLPVKVQDAMFAMMGRIFLGDLRKYGMPAPPAGAITRGIKEGLIVGIDNGFVKALKAGRFTIVPEVDSLDERSVHLVDGRTIEPDVVICATGYRTGLESLVGDLGVLDERGKPRWVADQASSEHPGLWFFGMNPSIYSYFWARKNEAPRLADKIALSLRG